MFCNPKKVADVFERSLRLRDPVAPQQLIGDIECDALPEPDYNRQCNCKCDVPMGCHGITGKYRFENYFCSEHP